MAAIRAICSSMRGDRPLKSVIKAAELARKGCPYNKRGGKTGGEKTGKKSGKKRGPKKGPKRGPKKGPKRGQDIRAARAPSFEGGFARHFARLGRHPSR